MSADNYANTQGGSVLRSFGLFVLAILTSVALVGVMASSAAAKEQVGFFVAGEESESEEEQPRFEAEEYTAYPAGGGNDHVWELNVGNMECPVDLSGKLTGANANLALQPFIYYFSCSSPLGGTVTVMNTGCHYEIDVLNEGPPYLGSFTLQCGEEGSLTLSEGGACSYSFSTQSGQVELENVGKSGPERRIDMAFKITGLKYTTTGFPLLCKSGEHEDGTYTGTAKMYAYDSEF